MMRIASSRACSASPPERTGPPIAPTASRKAPLRAQARTALTHRFPFHDLVALVADQRRPDATLPVQHRSVYAPAMRTTLAAVVVVAATVAASADAAAG